MKTLLIALVGVGILAAILVLVFDAPTMVASDALVTEADEVERAPESTTPVSSSLSPETESTTNDSEDNSLQAAQDVEPASPSDDSPSLATAAVIPVPASAEIRSLFERSQTIRETHEQLEREQVDSQWGPTTEAQLLTYFSQEPEIIRQLGSPYVYCRSTLCEIQVRSHEMGGRALSMLITDVYEEPWAADLRFNGIATLVQADGSYASVIFMRRGDIRDSQTQSLGPASKAI